MAGQVIDAYIRISERQVKWKHLRADIWETAKRSFLTLVRRIGAAATPPADGTESGVLDGTCR
jgi:hypothetical protein